MAKASTAARALKIKEAVSTGAVARPAALTIYKGRFRAADLAWVSACT
jgi:hypothetical protein